MKRCLALLVCTALLCSGCGKQRPQPTEATPDVPDPTEPPTELVEYEPAHRIEVGTKGAVKYYALNVPDCYDMVPMGQGVLLLSGVGYTTLTYMEEGKQPIHTELGCTISADHPAFRVSEKGVSYYDSNNHILVFLDGKLQELSRTILPDELQGSPVLSQDWQRIYYYTVDSLRCFELATGISRLLQESRYPNQQVGRLCFEDQVLQCLVSDGTVEKTRFVSVATGEILFEAECVMSLHTQGQNYFTRWQEGDQSMLLFGQRNAQPRQIDISEDGSLYPLLSGEYMLKYSMTHTGVGLTCFDLKLGNRISAVTLEGVAELRAVLSDPDTGFIWLLAGSMWSEEQALYCWNPAMGQMEGESFLSAYYTPNAPDLTGLQRCQDLAATIGQDHNVMIRIWDQADDILPSGYLVTTEHQVPVYESSLEVLDLALDAFPNEIFRKLGKKSHNNKLTICLVRQIYGTSELGSQTQENGVHFWSDGDAYLLLPVNEQLQDNLYHELFHAIDSYVLTESKRYDNWESLNPVGFSYDYSYIANENRDPEDYLNPDNRAFIDVYSMSYPKEDRARIMDYAIAPGNEECFTAPILHMKLEILCKGIREAFGLEKGQIYLWEQYL